MLKKWKESRSKKGEVAHTICEVLPSIAFFRAEGPKSGTHIGVEPEDLDQLRQRGIISDTLIRYGFLEEQSTSERDMRRALRAETGYDSMKTWNIANIMAAEEKYLADEQKRVDKFRSRGA